MSLLLYILSLVAAGLSLVATAILNIDARGRIAPDVAVLEMSICVLEDKNATLFSIVDLAVLDDGITTFSNLDA